MPGVVAGALMAFTLSIDDFVITFFTAGAGVPTLPLQIYTMIKIAVTPEVNARVDAADAADADADRHRFAARARRAARQGLTAGERPRCRLRHGGWLLVVAAALALAGCRRADGGKKDEAAKQDAAEASSGKRAAPLQLEQLHRAEKRRSAFEAACKCKLVQDYYSDNEELLAKLAAGAKGYDILVPTGNAVQPLIAQGACASSSRSTRSSAEPQQHQAAVPEHRVRSGQQVLGAVCVCRSR